MGPARWVHLNGSHELYNAGHLYEAAVAHFQATGKRTLLDVAIKTRPVQFGVWSQQAEPSPDTRNRAGAHQARGGDRRPRYLELASFFVDQRGRSHDTQPYPDGPFAMYNDREYKQDHLPVTSRIAPSDTPCARPISTPA